MPQSSRRESTQAESRPVNDSATPTPVSGESSRDSQSIARAAYQRYEARGREDGHDVEDWLAAEREIKAASASEDTTPSGQSDVA